MRRTAALLLMLLSMTACHLSETRKRAAIQVSTFVLQSAVGLQGRTALTQSSVRPAPQLPAADSAPAAKQMICTRRLLQHPVTASL